MHRWRAPERPVEKERKVVFQAQGHTPAALLRLTKELGLEGQAKEAFLALQQDFLNRLLDGREEIQKLQRSLRRQITAKRPDREEIDRLLGELADAYVALESAFIDDLLASRDLLNPQQERIYLRFMERVRQARTTDMRRHLRQQRGEAGKQHPSSP